jgi:hypothetical protein
MYTVSPKRQYRGLVSPTTPATTGPQWTPIRTRSRFWGRWLTYNRVFIYRAASSNIHKWTWQSFNSYHISGLRKDLTADLLLSLQQNITDKNKFSNMASIKCQDARVKKAVRQTFTTDLSPKIQRMYARFGWSVTFRPSLSFQSLLESRVLWIQWITLHETYFEVYHAITNF